MTIHIEQEQKLFEINPERDLRSKREITFLWDLDGVWFKAQIPILGIEFPPIRTTRDLLLGKSLIPIKEKPFRQWQPSRNSIGTLKEKWDIKLHKDRPIKPEAIEALNALNTLALKHQRKVGHAACSGREKNKHEITKQRLEQEGCLELFNQGLLLNMGVSSSGWKETRAQLEFLKGNNVIEFDDDIKAGLKIARVGPKNRIRAYILRNLSNHQALLRRGKVEIPENLIIVGSLKEAVSHLEQTIDELE